jgi:hypothetical protein
MLSYADTEHDSFIPPEPLESNPSDAMAANHYSEETKDRDNGDTAVLKEIPGERLNSPTKGSSSSRLATALSAVDENTSTTSSDKSDQITNALAAMLAAKQASRPRSNGDDPTARRKRSALGRALSNSTEVQRLSAQSSPQKHSPAEGIEQADNSAHIMPTQSQKIIYEDQTMRERRERILAELGGEAVDVEKNTTPGKKSRRKSSRKKNK